jgi:rhodanese-related sulfurtransferase
MVKRVTPVEAEALLKQGWIYLDVRSIPEFEGGHPTGAANVPLLHQTGGRMAPNPAFQSVVEWNFPKDAKIVVGCKAGGRSLQAATLMEAAGYTNIVDMRGGFHGERDNFGRVSCAGWAECGLPCEASADAEKTYAQLEMRATLRK